jgi:catechol 2,3-dioxygenase-like lactoylglutathione lyase family enzyme
MSIAALKLLSADPATLRRFYCRTFGASEFAGGCVLGEERIEIAPAADPRPDLFRSNETGFQHFALVVADMGRAYAGICAWTDWRPISLAGPERLPASSGGATAFKFRDPEGHPLELLQFAADAVPALWRARFDAEPRRMVFGIDHTGIAVHDIEASVRLWSSVGLIATHRQRNRGQEQARLDGFADAGGADVEIVALSPSSGVRPGVELLGYRRPPATIRAAADASTAATAIVLASPPPAPRDLDGHRIEFRSAPT